jgi:hypothetical protein
MVLLKNVAIISGGIKIMKKCIDLSIGKTTIKKEIDGYGLDFSNDLGKFTNDMQYVTVVVKTTINADNGMSDYVCNTLSGIESDSGKDYFDEIITELKYQNGQELLKMGFTEKEIDESLNNAKEVE